MGKSRALVLGIILLLSFGLKHARADDLSASDLSPLDRPGYNPEYDQYERAPSRFAVGFRGAVDSFPIKSAAGNSYQLFVDWVLPFQKQGLFSLGGHLGSFPVKGDNTSATGIPYPNYASLMAGVQFRYEFLYVQNQFLVPTAAVEADLYRLVTNSVTTTAADGTTSTTNTTTSGVTLGFDVGLMFNLGVIDKETARDAYQTINMTRAYLTVEYHPLKMSNADIDLSGNFFYFGLRLEFE